MDANEENQNEHTSTAAEEMPATEDNGWYSDTQSIDDFLFDFSQQGVKLFGDPGSSPIDIFNQLWNDDIMNLLVQSTNNY